MRHGRRVIDGGDGHLTVDADVAVVDEGLHIAFDEVDGNRTDRLVGR